ncbi:MAG TPA: MarR family transcriptional regulator [Deltaproteobacteria bacterium]|nr:MarR family transcriptional regulator [Deltaproteobacteria bacterium]HOM27867.1 MarR family transcriptional regulator [Deltaproteobacteria bacterium]HPP79776.1 MarR family transcriptional regulator [Deltaproteobacteria bacterium]
MTVSDRNFLYTLTVIRRGLFAFLRRRLRENGIEGLEPSSGDILHAMDAKGPLTIGELARCTSKHKSTVSPIVKRLEEMGFVSREKDASDGRRSTLRLSERADACRPVLLGLSREMNERLFMGFTEEERRTLFSLMGRVLENARRMACPRG